MKGVAQQQEDPLQVKIVLQGVVRPSKPTGPKRVVHLRAVSPQREEPLPEKRVIQMKGPTMQREDPLQQMIAPQEEVRLQK